MPKEIVIKRCPEAESLAQSLIGTYHKHLVNARILFLVTTQPMRSKDRVILGKAAKIAPLLRYLSSYVDQESPSVMGGYDFILLFSHQEWGLLEEAGKRAAVDHELSHCWEEVKQTKKGERRTWKVLGHDVEEFQAVIERHGLWRYDVRRFVEAAARQLPLPLAPTNGVLTQAVRVAAQASA